MRYEHSIAHCLDAAPGVTAGELDAALAKLAPAFETLQIHGDRETAPLLDLAAREEDLPNIRMLAEGLRARFKHVIVAGAGGSSLSGRALIQLLPLLRKPEFRFLETIDPDLMTALMAQLDAENSCFVIISKSGRTAETLSQFYLLLNHVLQKTGVEGARERFVVITGADNSPLRRSAKQHGLRILDHEATIGGRFSILTNVGLLPAAMAGLDIAALRRGALSVVTDMERAKHAGACAAAQGAALQYAFIEKATPMNVMLPYAERLSGFAAWYRQLWAESLGKGGKGSTPIRAAGTTDQHSQLQLYLDGPKDKLFHLILLERAGSGPKIGAPAEPELDYLKNKTMGDVMAAEQEATLATLISHRCPVRLIRLKRLDEEALGALLMHFMLEVILTARLLAIDPFGQPAVEEGKKLARDYLLKGAS